MKIKCRILLGTLVAMAVVSFGISTVNASSWHKGLPSTLRYTRWYQAKHHKDRLTFAYSTFAFWGPTGGARFGLPENQVKYKVIRHHYYLVHSRDRFNTFSGRYFKYINKNKLIQIGDRKGYTTGKITFYRY